MKFPEPPPIVELAAIGPELRGLPAGAEFWRVYYRGGHHPTLWSSFRAYGPTNGRFDHQIPPPSAQARRIIYLADCGITCLAEVFQDGRTIDRRSREPWLAGFQLESELELLDLTGPWPTRAGASMAINCGPRPRARRWSRAIYEAFPTVQGVYYCSSMHGNAPSVALYERSESALPPRPFFNRPLCDPALLEPLKNAAHTLGYGLI